MYYELFSVSCAADAIETEILGTKTVTGVKRSREEDLDPSEVGPAAEALLDLVPESPAEEESNGLPVGSKNSEPSAKNSAKSKKKKKKGQKVRFIAIDMVYHGKNDGILSV